jgi:hypothetical protein
VQRGDGLTLGLGVEAVGEDPGAAIADEFLHQSGVHGVAGTLSHDAAFDAAAGEGQVADEVQDLVADELIREPQRRRHGRLAAEDDGAGVGRAADQAHIAEHGLVFLEAEGAGGGDQIDVVAHGEVAAEALAADGLGKVDGVVDLISGAGIDADKLGAFSDFDLLDDLEVLSAAALLAEAGFLEGLDVRQGAAVEDGDFEIVDFDDDVVDAETDERGESRCSVVWMRTDWRMSEVA